MVLEQQDPGLKCQMVIAKRVGSCMKGALGEPSPSAATHESKRTTPRELILNKSNISEQKKHFTNRIL